MKYPNNSHRRLKTGRSCGNNSLVRTVNKIFHIAKDTPVDSQDVHSDTLCAGTKPYVKGDGDMPSSFCVKRSVHALQLNFLHVEPANWQSGK